MPKARSLAEISDLDGVAQGEAVVILKQLDGRPQSDPMKVLMVATHLLALHMARAQVDGGQANELFDLTLRKLKTQYETYRKQIQGEGHGPH